MKNAHQKADFSHTAAEGNSGASSYAFQMQTTAKMPILQKNGFL